MPINRAVSPMKKTTPPSPPAEVIVDFKVLPAFSRRNESALLSMNLKRSP